MADDEDFEPQHSEIAALKEYIDDRVENIRASQENQWMDALMAAGFSRETVENSVDTVAKHGMTRRAALGVVAASVFGAGVFTGQATAAPGDDGDTVWGSETNRSDWYADEIDANHVTATSSQYESVNAGDITITDGELSSDPLNPTEWSVRNNTAGEIRLAGTGVDVTADGTKQNIFDYVGNEAVDLIIVGKRDDATSRFIDHVSVFPGGINQYSSQGNPGARTYTQSGTTVEISFTDNSNPYNLTVIARGGGKS